MILRKKDMTYTRGIQRAVLAVLALLWLAPPSQAGFFFDGSSNEVDHLTDHQQL